MSLKGSCGRKLTELVAYHIFSYIYRNVLTAVVNGECMSYELREDC